METIKVDMEDLKKMKEDIEMIKEMLLSQREMEEIELTDWAKNELEEARKRPRSEKIPHEEVKRMILKK